jgi:hypothetical protein
VAITYYDCGDGQAYTGTSALQDATDDMPGNLATGGEEHVRAYAVTGDYRPVDGYTGFTNPDSTHFTYYEAMTPHKGIAGAGQRVIPQVGDTYGFRWMSYMRVEGFEITGLSNNTTFNGVPWGATTQTNARVWDMLIHGISTSIGNLTGMQVGLEGLFYNNMVYNLTNTVNDGSKVCRAMVVRYLNAKAYNNTLWNMFAPNAAVNYLMYMYVDISSPTNNYAGGAGTDYHWETGAVALQSCISSDPTAEEKGGVGNLINKAGVDQFVSIAVGSEDLHLKAGSDCENAGTPVAEVTIDIDGDTRDVSTPDAGADEFAIGGIVPMYNQLRRRA